MFRVSVIIIVGILCCAFGAEGMVQAEPKPASDILASGGVILPYEAPYQVAVLRYGSFRCGGALISSVAVVATAFCIVNTAAADFRVRAGSATWHHGGFLSIVNYVSWHPFYRLSSDDYNVGILGVNIPEGGDISPISLPFPGTVLDTGTALFASGFGTTRQTAIPTVLYGVTLDAWAVTVCEIYFDRDLPARQGCSLAMASRDVCEIDPSAPLVYNNTLYGLVDSPRCLSESDVTSQFLIHTNLADGEILDYIKRAASID